MINTKELMEGDIVLVDIGSEETGDYTCPFLTKNIKCRFCNGLFVNIENNQFKNEVYGSSVLAFRGVK